MGIILPCASIVNILRITVKIRKIIFCFHIDKRGLLGYNVEAVK